MTLDADVLVIGAGHAGLCVAHGLRRSGLSFLVIDAGERVGDSWRRRWDSLELFTPRFLNGVPDMPFPEGPTPFPGKDEVADHLERYAREMRFPLRMGARVRSLRRTAGSMEAVTDQGVLRAKAAVVATGAFQTPRVPDLAAGLDPAVTQLHSSDYRDPRQLPPGPVVVVGAANSGSEIAVEVARERPTVLAAGRMYPLAPRRFRDPRWWRLAQLRTWLLRGRRPPSFLPWPVRVGGVTKVDLAAAVREHGMRIAARAIAADGDVVRFADGSEAHARTIIWATGFRLDHSWIAAPQRDRAVPRGPHGRGSMPGLWLVIDRFLFAIRPRAADVARDVAAQLGGASRG